jgi:4-amino-4-deoxy-L-arabinose transferase-like glycosyltransferase
MKIKNKTHVMLGLIILLGLFLRIFVLFKYGNFWDDEMFNFIYSQKSWPAGLIYWLWETNPPLHMLILKIWFFVFPANELSARLPSVIAGTASIYFIYKLGKEIFDEKAALLAAFYLAIHPYHIFWSATSRIYVFLMLFAILSTRIIYKQFFLGDQSSKTKILGAIINGLLFFSHLSSLFLLAGQFIALSIFKGKASVISWVKYSLVPFALGGLWVALSLYIKRNNHLEKAWFLNLNHNLRESLNPLFNIIVGQFWTIPGMILIILLCALIIYKIYKTKSLNLLFLITLIATPIMLSVALRVWHIKFIIAILPLLILIISYSFSNTFQIVFTILCITTISLLGLNNLWHTLPITDWHKIETYFKSYESNDKFLLVYNHYILKPQISRYLPDNVSKKSKTLITYKNMGWDEIVVQKNYIPLKLSEAERNHWYDENNLDNYSIVALVQNEFPAITQLNDLFNQRGWKLIQNPVKIPIVGIYNLYMYEKN